MPGFRDAPLARGVVLIDAQEPNPPHATIEHAVHHPDRCLLRTVPAYFDAFCDSAPVRDARLITGKTTQASTGDRKWDWTDVQNACGAFFSDYE
jgi:hypothetical protein